MEIFKKNTIKMGSLESYAVTQSMQIIHLNEHDIW